MSERDEKRLDIVRELTNGRNWKPNATDIANKLGLSVTTVWDYLKKLERQGRIVVTIKVLSDTELIAAREESKKELEES